MRTTDDGFYAVATDSTGGTVPGATVTLTHEGTGATATKTTNSQGEAVFDFLRVGNYSLRIEAKGFKRIDSKDIELSAAQMCAGRFCWKSAP